jgi:hypothetical protein
METSSSINQIQQLLTNQKKMEKTDLLKHLEELLSTLTSKENKLFEKMKVQKVITIDEAYVCICIVRNMVDDSEEKFSLALHNYSDDEYEELLTKEITAEDFTEGRAIVNKMIEQLEKWSHISGNSLYSRYMRRAAETLNINSYILQCYADEMVKHQNKIMNDSAPSEEGPNSSRTVVVENHGHAITGEKDLTSKGVMQRATEMEDKPWNKLGAEDESKKKEEHGAGLEMQSNELLKSEEAPAPIRDEELRNDKIRDSFKSNRNESPDEVH